ncbi:MAG: hypothetical protein ABH872_00595 [Candidatus Omnitrophota bacterium]
MLFKRKSQSFLDYAALIALVSLSLIAMTGYIFSSIRARTHHAWADIYDPITGVR